MTHTASEKKAFYILALFEPFIVLLKQLLKKDMYDNIITYCMKCYKKEQYHGIRNLSYILFML